MACVPNQRDPFWYLIFNYCIVSHRRCLRRRNHCMFFFVYVSTRKNLAHVAYQTACVVCTIRLSVPHYRSTFVTGCSARLVEWLPRKNVSGVIPGFDFACGLWVTRRSVCFRKRQIPMHADGVYLNDALIKLRMLVGNPQLYRFFDMTVERRCTSVVSASALDSHIDELLRQT